MTEHLAQWGLQLLFSAAIVAIVTRRIGLPYTVGLVIAGIGMAYLPLDLHVKLSKDLIFSVLLPPLVFEAAIHLTWPDLKVDLGIAILLATIGVLIAAAITAAGMHYGVNWTWSEAALFGVLISATRSCLRYCDFQGSRCHGAIS